MVKKSAPAVESHLSVVKEEKQHGIKCRMVVDHLRQAAIDMLPQLVEQAESGNYEVAKRARLDLLLLELAGVIEPGAVEYGAE